MAPYVFQWTARTVTRLLASDLIEAVDVFRTTSQNVIAHSPAVPGWRSDKRCHIGRVSTHPWGPDLAVGGLLILAETDLREQGVDRRKLLVAQEETGKDDRQLASASVSAAGRPAGMASADHARQVDSHLHEIH